MNIDPKVWMVVITEITEETENIPPYSCEVTRVYFNEENHREAREYVKRMTNLHTPRNEHYQWFISDPTLVDDDTEVDYNGMEFLDHIKHWKEYQHYDQD